MDGDASTLAGSEALETLHGVVAGQPALDIDLEARVQQLCRDAVRRGLLSSAHDCSDGGLAVALAESCILGNLGATITARPEGRWDAAPLRRGPVPHPGLLDPTKTGALRRLATRHNVPVLRLGRVTADNHLRIARLLNVPLEDASKAWAKPSESCSGTSSRDATHPHPRRPPPHLRHTRALAFAHTRALPFVIPALSLRHSCEGRIQRGRAPFVLREIEV